MFSVLTFSTLTILCLPFPYLCFLPPGISDFRNCVFSAPIDAKGLKYRVLQIQNA